MAELDENVIQSMLVLCIGMAQKCHLSVLEQRVRELDSECPETMLRQVAGVASYAARAFESALAFVRQSPHVNSPLHRLCWTLKCDAWGIAFRTYVPCLLIVPAIGGIEKDLRQLELACRAVHIALFFAEASTYEALTITGNDRFMEAIDAEVEKIMEPESLELSTRVKDFMGLRAPAGFQELNRLNTRVTYTFLGHFVNAVLDAVGNDLVVSNNYCGFVKTWRILLVAATTASVPVL